MNNTWEIKDPKGFNHILLQDDEGYWGAENLAHCYEPIQRPYIMSRLTFELEKSPDMGEWDGYTWIKK